MKALIAFLGYVGIRGYEETTYFYPDGTKGDKTKFFTTDLITRCNPQRVIILGTTGSSWEHLYEVFGLETEDGLEDLQPIRELIESDAVEGQHLQELAYRLSQQSKIEVKLKLIPSDSDIDSQLEILRVIAKETENCSALVLDITHGFRHFPMIAMVSAIYLKFLRTISIEGFWYGKYEKGKDSKAYDLKGLLTLFDWIQAMSQHQVSGDYGKFSDLLSDVNPQFHSRKLSRAAFEERKMQATNAAKFLAQINEVLEKDELDGVAGLFQPKLAERLSWANNEDLAIRQRRLAKEYLKRKDYLRAIVFAYESLISQQVAIDNVKGLGNYNVRIKARLKIENHLRLKSNKTKKKIYERIKNLRNTMAHGTELEPKVRRKIGDILNNEEQLKIAILKFLRIFKNFYV